MNAKPSSLWKERLRIFIERLAAILETDLATRILVAMIYFPILLLSTYFPEAFAFMMLLALGASWHEYLCFRQKPQSRDQLVRHIYTVVFFTLPPMMILFSLPLGTALVIYGLALQLSWIQSIRKQQALEEWLKSISFYLFGAIYITGLFSMLLLVHSFTFGGVQAIWFLLLVVGATDTLAYFVGRQWGKTPFFQNISPSKTREGLIGGLAGGVLSAVVFGEVLARFDFSLPETWVLGILGLFVSLASVFGDLFESQLKRFYKVKDSGKTLPGHGGVLDRFDGVLFGAVPLALFMIIFGGFWA